MSQRTPKAKHCRQRWHQITVSTPAVHGEIVASYLAELTHSGVEIQTPREPDRQRIIAYLPATENIEEARQDLEFFLETLAGENHSAADFSITLDCLVEEDWNGQWKKHFKPQRFTPHIVIKPTWEPYTPLSDEVVIELDPGMAFGTGHHASTHMMLQLIDTLYHTSDPPPKVLDVGCGTGILAMACARLGAGDITALDNDPEAIIVARENIETNHLQHQIRVTATALEALPDRYNLVLANIIHDTLMSLAPALCARIQPGGHLLLAGILKGQQERNILQRYKSLGLIHDQTLHQDEWASFQLRKTP